MPRSPEWKSRQTVRFDEVAKENQKADLRDAFDRERKEAQERIANHETQLTAHRQQLSELQKDSARDPGTVDHQALADTRHQIADCEAKIARDRREIAEMPERERLGREAIDSATVTEGPDGTITMWHKVSPVQPRLGYEKSRSGLDTTPGMERAHGCGAGVGFECDHGILLTEKGVNQQAQKNGIETDIREKYACRQNDTELWQKVTISRHPDSQHLAEAHYEVYAGKTGGPEVSRARKDGDTRGMVQVYEATVTANRNGKVQEFDRKHLTDHDHLHFKSAAELNPDTPTRNGSPPAAREKNVASTMGGDDRRSQPRYAEDLAPREQQTASLTRKS